MNGSEPRSGRSARIWILAALVVIGSGLALWQPTDIATLLERGQTVATSPLFLAAVVIGMAVLFSFGLPGSLGFWLIAPFNPPWLATVLLVVASTAGALGGYGFAGHLGRDWRPSARWDRILGVLRRHGDVFTLTALRILPGFPHSVINFGGGVLRLPLPGFMAATVIGGGVKWGVYASAVHGVADAVAAGEALRPGVLLPLVVLVLLGLAGAWVRRRL